MGKRTRVCEILSVTSMDPQARPVVVIGFLLPGGHPPCPQHITADTAHIRAFLLFTHAQLVQGVPCGEGQAGPAGNKSQATERGDGTQPLHSRQGEYIEAAGKNHQAKDK